MEQKKELKIGIVGCGMISRYHALAVQETEGISLTGCCSHSYESACALAKEFSITAWESYEDMLADGGLDTVAICTPSGDHARQILMALNAGKHVVVEKPMCLTLEEADKVVRKADETGLVVCTISQSRFSDAARVIKSAIDAGHFGRMVSASLMMRYFRSQEYYDQAGWRGTIAGDGGGVLMNQGIHGIDLLCWLMGRPVSACGYSDTLLRDIEVEDTVAAAVRFVGGAVASIDATVCSQPAYAKKLILCGEKGSVELTEDSITLWSLPVPCPLPIGAEEGNSGAADPRGISHHNHTREYADFVHAVHTGAPVLIDAREGRVPLQVIHAIYESSATGKRVDIPAAENTPVRLDNPRVWRTYLGGRLLDELHGISGGENGHFPEEWIMSVVAARNVGREDIKDEGMSHLFGTSQTLKDLLDTHPDACPGGSPGVLVKLIDSAERLTLQVHPDREKAMELFHSPYGKTECWHILGTRDVDGQTPCIYLGFRPGITREYWKHLFDTQDIPGMLDAMQKFEVKPGDTILIEGGMPHAIGAGCLLAEIQEPTDFTIRVERTTPSGFAVDDFLCHQGLGFDRMFDAFCYDDMDRQTILDRYFIKPDTPMKTESGTISTLIGYENTPLFRLDEIRTDGTITVPDSHGFSGLYVLEGRGMLTAGLTRIPLEKTCQIFVPARTGEFTLKAGEGAPLRVLHFFGKK